MNRPVKARRTGRTVLLFSVSTVVQADVLEIVGK